MLLSDKAELPSLMPIGDFCRIVLGVPEEKTNVSKSIREKWIPSEVVQITVTDKNGVVLESYSERWVRLNVQQRKVSPEVIARIMKERKKIRNKYLKLIL